jgi:ferredoxin-NADP reductase
MQLFVRSITWLAPRIRGYELADPRGRDLPGFEAGAHVELLLPNGLARAYSLYGDPAERRHYRIAVLREENGRGGSAYIQDRLQVGDRVEVSAPKNDFPLAPEARRYHLLAGGIGIAPIMAIIAELRRRRADWVLDYLTRSPEDTAFLDELQIFAAMGRARFHHDGGDPSKGLDIARALADPTPGTQLYYCGPSGMMAAAAEASRHWPQESVHSEYFARPAAAHDMPRPPDRPFRVRLARSGGEYEVGADESIVEALRRHGIAVRTSCELGYCGACLTPYRAGEPLHRDLILDAERRRRFVLICCARAASDMLELDI